MNNFRLEEGRCSQAFSELGECYHLWTSERCEVIFRSDDEFRSGMNVIGICARLFPQIRIIAFEIMSNHLHFTIAGCRTDVLAFFDCLKKYLMRHFRKRGRIIDWSGFNVGIRELVTLEDVRNVILYNNRNGYVVSDIYTPFSYPWGANRYYFCPDSVALASLLSRPVSQRERQAFINSRVADNIEGLMMYEGCISPVSFCDIASGESLFRGPVHYFNRLGRNIEGQKEIAREIGESIFYTDDELFSAILSVARNRYGIKSLSDAGSTAKLELARIMRYDYNASTKQIARFLKLSEGTLASIGIAS